MMNKGDVMGDWIEVGEYFLLNILSGSRVKVCKSYGDIIILYKSGKDEYEQKFRSLEKAQSFYNKLKSQLIPKTIYNDYGPDNVSTPDDIAETNELESLRGLVEDIYKILHSEHEVEQTSAWNWRNKLIKLEKIIKPSGRLF